MSTTGDRRAVKGTSTPPSLVEAIESLSNSTLDLLTVLVLAGEPMARTAWANEAGAHGIRRSRSRALSSIDLRPTCEQLEAAGLITQGNDLNRWHVRPSVALCTLERSMARRRLSGFLARHDRNRAGKRRSSYDYDHYRDITDLRLAVILRQPERATRALADARLGGRHHTLDLIAGAFGDEPQASWLAVLSAEARLPYLSGLIEGAHAWLRPVDPGVLELAIGIDDRKLRLEVARLLTMRGEGDRARELGALPKWGPEGIALLDAFWQGDYETAAELGEAAVVAMSNRKHKLLPAPEGVCHALALAVTCSGDPSRAAALERLLEAIGRARGMVDSEVLLPLGIVLGVLKGAPAPPLPYRPTNKTPLTFSTTLAWLLHVAWLLPQQKAESATPKRTAMAIELARRWQVRAVAGGFAPVARELSAIISAFEGGSPGEQLAGAFEPPAPWETALAGLEAALESSAHASTPQAEPSRELWWELSLDGSRFIALVPRLRESARAKKGQAITIRKLLGAARSELDTVDRLVVAAVEHGSGRGGRPQPVLGLRAVAALIGHPRVISSEGQPLSVVRGTATIRSAHRNGHTHVELQPAALLQRTMVIEQPEPGRVVVYERPVALEPLVSTLARKGGLEVPDVARVRLARTLTRLGTAASVALEGDLHASAKTQPADPRPLLQLGWSGTSLDVRIRVAPLGPRGAHVRPGTGAPSFITELAHEGEVELMRCERDLGEEVARHRAMLDACPLLAGLAVEPLHHVAATLPDALDVLRELDALGDTVVLTWASGQKLDLPLRAELRHLHVNVSGGAVDWLSVDATVELDDAVVLRFEQLLGRRAGGGAYVQLGPNRFVALSEKLRRHLDGLASLGTAEGDTVRASPAMLTALDELASEAPEGFTFDREAQAKLAALRKIAQWTPRSPRGFQASLRDYQHDGFVWMARLARAGLGGCLADDMGLGKTVQALALLAQRVRQGPALVVCPTSVTHNWVAEATRFAPTLRLHLLAEADDRPARLGSLGGRDVVVCSYGLLHTEADALAEVEFATVVFDEAHALKNHATKRARAARRLRAGFRLALTGTPVENALGELWSLFHVLVPGMLGNRTRFTDTFTTPIAAGDRERTARLRAILRPFLLRRTKAQVLDELPPRSEITLRVEPYPKQQAFYEAVRRRALDRVADVGAKKARFEILAQITRLRQAAIDPRVLDEDAGPKGAKLDVLLEHLEQLCAQGHRALVFTQFLGSMALVRSRLQAAGLSFFELDGSTSAAERSRRIEAFQAGEGDVFLLSLRAGGMGVNLTGADYVFHLDPWWNPAVEDQATDRAHRMGQQRPVTVYRLVTEGTVEDKIVALHASKRQLADDVLAGLEKAAVPDLQQLRQLLAE